MSRLNNNSCEEDDRSLEKIPSEDEDSEIDTSTYEIVLYGADYTLSVFYDKLTREEIIVPDFQRKYVWTIKQASKLVESFLLGLPVPGIFLYKVKESGKLLVVDGQQRLKTIQAFRDEKFPIYDKDFALIGVKSKWEGKKYSDLDMVDRLRYDDSILRTTIIQQINPQDNTSIYHIFERLNTGGTRLHNQEIRNSIYYGKFNNFLRELNMNPIWRKLYNFPNPNKRMKDVELILRFFALYEDINNYEKPMNEFLSKYMAAKKDIDENEIKEMRELFIDTIQFINDNIGNIAFRPKRNINIAAYDSVMYTIAKYKFNLRRDIKTQISELFKDKKYIKNIREGTTDKEVILKRMELAKQYLVE